MRTVASIALRQRTASNQADITLTTGTMALMTGRSRV